MNAIEAKQQILEILEANPRRINPRVGGFCRYSNKANTRHCIVGWMAQNNGWDLPSVEYCGEAGMAALDYQWPIGADVVEVLTKAQMVADKETVDGGNWGKAAKVLREGWDL